MRYSFQINHSDVLACQNTMDVLIRNVGRGTKIATEQACKEILAASKEQCPIETGTLVSTGFYAVTRRTDVKGYVYEGMVGYAGVGDSLGNAHDAYNPTYKKMASSYAFYVHEDLTASHARGKKAKFLEDPAREYGARKFARVAEGHWLHSIYQRGGSGGE